tara:strand:- start:384 stop:569 length:186 start_codon:yes stop_codon:yes gene_type:complete
MNNVTQASRVIWNGLMFLAAEVTSMNYLIIGLAVLLGVAIVGSFLMIRNWNKINEFFHLKH